MSTRLSETTRFRNFVQSTYIKAEDNLELFFRSAWRYVLEPNSPLLTNWHQGLMADYLTACRDKVIKRLIVNIPPRYTKSNIVTVCFPPWVWAKTPHERFLTASHDKTLSMKHSVDRRMILESLWYQTAWGHRFQLATDQNVKGFFLNTERGHMLSTSIGGGATGQGGNYIIIDDPHDVTKALSKVQRESDCMIFDQKFRTRLDDKENGVIIIVMQRLHEEDLTGHVLKKEGTVETGGVWHHLKLPVEASKQTIIEFPVSKIKKVRESGNILHPERHSKESLEAEKIALGSAAYAGQYQQEPSAETGNIIQRDWIRFYDELPKSVQRWTQSWDCAFKGLDTSDFVVGQTWCNKSADFFLVDQCRGQKSFPETLEAIRLFRSEYPQCHRTIVEDKANGSAVIDSLKREIHGLIPYNPKDSKESRVHAVSVLFESGNVWFPNPEWNPWVRDLIEELVSFPNASNDDQVDALSQALLDFMSGAKKVKTVRLSGF